MDSLLELPNEIIYQILSELPLKNLIKSEFICNFFKDFIRDTKWNHCVKKINDDNCLIHIIKTYNFTKYNLSMCNQITDASVALLSKCHTLDLYNCNQITNIIIASLRNNNVTIYK